MSSIPPPLALVTGASTGIGFELAREFAEHDFDVVLVADEPEVVDAAHRLSRPGSRVVGVRADLTVPAEVEALVARVGEMGALTALALNAGAGVGGEFTEESTVDEQLAVVDLNVRSTVHLAKSLVPGMLGRAHGRVLFTSSIAALAPGPYQSVYNASKSFVQSFAKALRAEVANTGVTVTSLMPGPTDTAFFRRSGQLDTPIGAGPKVDPAEVARAGFAAMMAGRAQVVTGSLLVKAQVLLGRVLPDRVLVAAHKLLTRPRVSGGGRGAGRA
ncbi:SDR family NAD(P)-dependent oxidoreductase [Actinokineospora auranticolor]|nr:SDR family NAD(P)-dependent oxidoreductase [Actinokineospora auranticolor]